MKSEPKFLNGIFFIPRLFSMADSDHEEELTIPRAAMNKMIKEICSDVRVANEARYVQGVQFGWGKF